MAAISRDGRRIEGTDVNTGKHVYQVGRTCFSDQRKFNKGYDNIKWDTDETESDSER